MFWIISWTGSSAITEIAQTDFGSSQKPIQDFLLVIDTSLYPAFTDPKSLQIFGQMFTVNRGGVAVFNALVCGESPNWGPRNSASKN